MADLEQQLRELLRQPEPPSWPDETNAYDHFLRRRARRARAVVTGAGLGLAALLAAVALVPRVLATGQPPVGQPGLVRNATDGYELAIPNGWRLERREGSLLLVSRTARIEVRRIFFNLADPSWTNHFSPFSPLGGIEFRRVEQPFQRRTRADGRAYLVEPAGCSSTCPTPTRAGTPSARSVASSSGGGYDLAWPAYCPRGTPCSVAAPFRGLLLQPSGRGYEQALRQLVESLRAIGNALPSVGPHDESPRLPAGPRYLLGSGHRAGAAWRISGYDLVEPTGSRRPTVWIDFNLAGTIDQGGWWLPPGASLWVAGPLGVAGAPLGAAGPSPCVSFNSASGRKQAVWGVVRKQVAKVRIELAGQPPVTVDVVGRQTPLAYAAFVGPALELRARVQRVVPLDANGHPAGPPAQATSPDSVVCPG
jgi:hypothetical protein